MKGLQEVAEHLQKMCNIKCSRLEGKVLALHMADPGFIPSTVSSPVLHMGP